MRCEECENGMCVLRDEVGNVEVIPALQFHRQAAISDIDSAIEHLLKLLPKSDKRTADSLTRAIQDLMHISAFVHVVHVRSLDEDSGERGGGDELRREDFDRWNTGPWETL